MKIVITDAMTVTQGDISLDALKDFGEVVIYPLTAKEDLIAHISDADAVLTNKSPITREVMAGCPNLRYIGLFATGYNNIDVEAAREFGITVCNAGSYSTDSVAQQVFAFILNHASNIANYNNFVQEGSWINSQTFSPFVFPTSEISKKTLGIFGFGSIGKAVSKIASAFNMRVIVHTRTERENDRNEYGITYVDFDTLLEESDYLSVHCPLTKATEKLFNEKTFANMKDGCYFINTSRGGVIDETALANAVKSGKLVGAGIDVLTVEPMVADCPLLNVDGITITPHVAWAPHETRIRLLSIVYQNIKNFIDGTPTNVVS